MAEPRGALRCKSVAISAAAGVILLCAACSVSQGPDLTGPVVAAGKAPGVGKSGDAPPPDLSKQSQAEADRKSAGCVTCHTKTDQPTMHEARTVRLGCVDCHGGDAEISISEDKAKGSPLYDTAKRRAHVQPRFPDAWRSSANPERSYTLLNRESPEFVRFINPGDLRAAPMSCGARGCHPSEVANVQKSMMTHGAMLWGAALYNNGVFPLKTPRFGESYSIAGVPVRLQTVPPPTAEEIVKKGVLPFLDPLPRFEIGQPGNILRIFERGGRKPLEVGLPELDEPPGRPERRLSARGLGTLNRTDPVWLGLQKTRLLDPLLSLLGTNDHPGDFRSSGCSACHVVYANDRSESHSGPYARFGHMGMSQTADPTIPKDEPGHPIKHQFTRSIPSSQCMVCHMHPGTNVVNTYFGYTWWDNETDGELMYPTQQRYPTAEETARILSKNPEGASVRGLWSDPKFLADVSQLNPKLKHTQFADFHGHGWIFRAAFKQDRKGNLLDAVGKIVSHDDAEKFKKAVHLKDIHLEKGMHCVDCHFKQDVHGNAKLYGEPRNAIETDCRDCHGTIDKRATLVTSGPAAGKGTNLDALKTPFGKRRFQFRGDRLFQRSMVTDELEWEVVQTVDTITPGSPHYSEKSRLAKTIRKDGQIWGDLPPSDKELAHADSRMTCFSCHSSWMTSCFGCHLSMKANERRPMWHNEGDITRNWTSYNFQVVRDDVFMLGIDGSVTGNRIAPVRSSSAVLVASQNQNREWVYSQQQTVSAEGFSGQAFNTHVPHTVRATETKSCTDCHVSSKNDNNAWMAQLLLQGTNFVNFLGRYVYVAEGTSGLEGVVVTEPEEPQAVIGSHLHRLAYPDNFRKHQSGGATLQEAYRHTGSDARSLQMRGEYLYVANGPEGFRVYDIASIDNKGFSERFVTAPVSPLGQRLYVRTKYATAVASPTTLAVDPTRSRRPENKEQPIHPLYAYIYVTDKYEGLIVVGAATLLDGNPDNNFLERAATFNPGGILDGAVNITVAGNYAYILCNRGLVVVSIENPLSPRVVAQVGPPFIVNPRAVAIQFRYAFVVDAEGMKVIDVTMPERPRPVPAATISIASANDIYVARSYAYIAAGPSGLMIVDVERPERPSIDQTFNAGGAINDARGVKVGSTNISLFAYLADGKNGLRVIQLTSPENTPGNFGFSPRPSPRLIATYPTRGPALAISKGLDRDRAVDESGNQVAVFGRLGARPFTLAEMQRLYLRNGQLYTVTDEPPGPGVSSKEVPKKEEEEPPTAPPARRRLRPGEE